MTTVLVFNSGSSSLKFGLYQATEQGPQALLHGGVELPTAGETATLKVTLEDGQQTSGALNVSTQADVVPALATLLHEHGLHVPHIIGHRIVHGGPHVRSHCLLNPQIMACLKAAQLYAPLHNASALAVLHESQRQFGRASQVVCLDTAFHAGLPDPAKVLPMPRELQHEGVERYGFHGLSCESIIEQLGDELPPRLVIAHLGNGASITAVKHGRSVDTSMSLTPAGGFPMSTRCGDIDPGVLLYLLREKKYDADRLEDMLNRRSGLLGISRLSSDMRALRAAARDDADAALAIAIFTQSVRKQIAAMAAVLEGIDLLVFTGGIGEHDTELRTQVCASLAWAGLSSSKVRAMQTQEEAQIARHALRLAGQFK